MDSKKRCETLATMDYQGFSRENITWVDVFLSNLQPNFTVLGSIVEIFNEGTANLKSSEKEVER
jgi:hypothetical protein